MLVASAASVFASAGTDSCFASDLAGESTFCCGVGVGFGLEFGFGFGLELYVGVITVTLSYVNCGINWDATTYKNAANATNVTTATIEIIIRMNIIDSVKTVLKQCENKKQNAKCVFVCNLR